MASRPTPVVQEDCTRMVRALDAVLSTMPNENHISAPNDRERIWHARRTLSGTITSLKSPFEGRLVKLDSRLAGRTNWFQHLTACRMDLEKALAQAEGGNFRLAEELRQSLRIVRNGAESHDEVFAGPVIRWLQARGIQPEPGARSFFAGRGGLLSTEREIAELEKERDAIIAQVEASLKYAEQFIGSMAAPVGGAV
jgi:hypothetical protein